MTFTTRAPAVLDRRRATAPVPEDDHERVIVRQDPATGMRLVVAVHSTVLGPALGGLRVRAYPGGLREALEDVLALARTMTLKASAAGLDLGGGKAVMIDDGLMPLGDPLRALRMEAAARVVDELDGLYVTAEDVGTTTADMDLIARTTRFVVGRSPSAGGGGDPSPSTAEGVLRATEVALAATYGSDSLDSRRVGIVGLGKVGSVLAGLLLERGATVLGYDLDPRRLERTAAGGVQVAASAREVLLAPLDVLAPCAVGGLIDGRVAAALDCSVVCGAANNQLAARSVADRLAERDILYVPDFMANSGGLIHVAAEWHRLEGCGAPPGLECAAERLEHALGLARAENVTPLAAAERLALDRIGARRVRAG